TYTYRWSWSAARAAPGFTIAYVSHKVLRFFLPVFVLLLAAGVVLASGRWAVPLLLGGAALLGVSAWAARRPATLVGRLGLVYALVVANLALLAGVFDALTGRVASSYVPTRRL
ncbi:MAG: hypothetical protein RI554_11495, partial [Trueperaceae bacterium]|nr:hypothetical protein [Trueperaceae bacterium]